MHLVASRVTYTGHVVNESNDYCRAMAILRRIEVEYGLRRVPCPTWRARAAPARERHAVARSARPSMRAALQSVVGAAARDSGTIAEFLAEPGQASATGSAGGRYELCW